MKTKITKEVFNELSLGLIECSMQATRRVLSIYKRTPRKGKMQLEILHLLEQTVHNLELLTAMARTGDLQ